MTMLSADGGVMTAEDPVSLAAPPSGTSRAPGAAHAAFETDHGPGLQRRPTPIRTTALRRPTANSSGTHADFDRR